MGSAVAQSHGRGAGRFARWLTVDSKHDEIDVIELLRAIEEEITFSDEYVGGGLVLSVSRR
jgi:hypothetical protein